LLPCHISQEGTPHHAEPGSIFRRKGTIKMSEITDQKLADSLEFVEVLKVDKDGNTVTVRVY
jgi:hypothetical protein